MFGVQALACQTALILQAERSVRKLDQVSVIDVEVLDFKSASTFRSNLSSVWSSAFRLPSGFAFFGCCLPYSEFQ